MGTFFLTGLLIHVFKHSLEHTWLEKILWINNLYNKPIDVLHYRIGKNRSSWFFLKTIKIRPNPPSLFQRLICHGSFVKFSTKINSWFKSLSKFSVSANQLLEKVWVQRDSNRKTACFHVSWESAVNWVCSIWTI